MFEGYTIRKNHLTINEAPEIFEFVNDDNQVAWFGREDEVTAELGTKDWRAGDEIASIGGRYRWRPQ